MAFGPFNIDFLRDMALPEIIEDLVELVLIDFAIMQNGSKCWLTMVDKLWFIAPSANYQYTDPGHQEIGLQKLSYKIEIIGCCLDACVILLADREC